MDDKEIKIQTIDLGKTISYLAELQKSNNQNYVTKEGLALLEGIVLTGNNSKVKVTDYQIAENMIQNLQQKILMQNDTIRGLKIKKKSWF